MKTVDLDYTFFFVSRKIVEPMNQFKREKDRIVKME